MDTHAQRHRDITSLTLPSRWRMKNLYDKNAEAIIELES